MGRLRAGLLMLAVVIVASGCGGKQLREENEQLRSEVDRQKQVEQDYSDKLRQVEQMSADEKAAMQGEMSQMRSEFNESLEQQDILVKNINDLTVIEIGEASLFSSGNADLTRKGANVIKELANVFNQYPGYHMRVEGHTDPRPISKALKNKYFSNWELSTARATSVVRYMVYGLNLPPEKLSAVGYAQYRPVADNKTSEGRAKNRRIRIVIFKAIAEKK